MTHPLQPERPSDLPVAPAKETQSPVLSEREVVAEGMKELLRTETITDPTDQRILNAASVFLQTPSLDRALVEKHQSNVAEVVAGYEMQQIVVPNEILAIHDQLGRLHQEIMKDAEKHLEKEPLTSVQLLAKVQNLDCHDKPFERKNNDKIAEMVGLMERLARSYLKDLEGELAKATPDIAASKKLMNLAYQQARLLEMGNANNATAMQELKEWQVSVVVNYPQAIAQLAQTYVDAINKDVAEPKSEPIMLRQWIGLAVGFDPSLAQELQEKYLQAIHKNCMYFLTQAEAELRKERPDFAAIERYIIVPPKYYTELAVGSGIPEKVQELQQLLEARRK